MIQEVNIEISSWRKLGSAIKASFLLPPRSAQDKVSHLRAPKLRILNFCPLVPFLYQPVKWKSVSTKQWLNRESVQGVLLETQWIDYDKEPLWCIWHMTPRGQHSSAAGWSESALPLLHIGLNWCSLQLKAILLPANGSCQTTDTLAFSPIRPRKTQRVERNQYWSLVNRCSRTTRYQI